MKLTNFMQLNILGILNNLSSHLPHKIAKEKGTFEVNLVFIYSDIKDCTKRIVQKLFITKKGTFSPSNKFGGWNVPPVTSLRFLRP